MSELRFGVNIRGAASRQEFLRFVRRAEELGFDVLAAPDHLGVTTHQTHMEALGEVIAAYRRDPERD